MATVQAIQEQLNKLGYGPLVVDGKIGPKTIGAIRSFQKDKCLEVDGKVGPKTEEALFGHVSRRPMGTAEIISKYGQPGSKNLVTIALPYKMIVSWDKKVKISTLECHKNIAENLKAVFNQILADYGEAKINELGINLYGGCYNYRKMRGGSEWSRHAWGIAIDLDPERNGLKTKWKNARFSRPEYKKMVDAFYKYGFLSYGIERDLDAMHFEIAS